ncbi:MAG: ribosomal protein S18-alanine N-acetyltransferase [Proteobacteria bacterium]|nr:ribosomal protein S18-alanine N-acetyltransferase [Pseudomonadota bacterium]
MERDNAVTTYAEDIIREMREDDLIDILEIENRSFISPWMRRTFEETIESPISTNSVIEINSEILGYIMLYSVEDEAHIMNLAVHPDYRGRGYASKLITRTVSCFVGKNVSEFFLEVREGNINAQRLYTKFGFKGIGKRKRYYTETNEDALLMKLSLHQ